MSEDRLYNGSVWETLLSGISIIESACKYFVIVNKKVMNNVIMQCMLMLLALKLEIK
jgi:hypothetical protein